MKVYLVGAGPGDPGLLTLKGRDVISRADVIIYDALANACLLDFAKPGAELIYAGKIADKHTLDQKAINELLAAKAKEGGGKIVARLKGGDPYIFGRGGEEAEYLQAMNIPFEEVPGISSAIAAPSYAGMPLTHRGCASSLAIITGHEDPDKAESSHNWEAFAKSGSTLVFVMGMKNLPSIAARLMENGMPAQTPAAIIYRGTTPMQKTLVATLEELPQKAKALGFSNPSLIVVGSVVLLHSKLAWFEKKPLLGRRIVVTRAREQASEMVRALEELGAEAIQCPTIRIAPPPDFAEIDLALDQISTYAWIIFTSANGVKYFWKRLESKGLDSRALASSRIAAIGPATSKALNSRGIRADLVPPSYVAESVAGEIMEREGASLAGKRVLLPRAAKARMVLPDTLAKAGCVVDVAPLYETLPASRCMEKLASMLRAGEIDCLAFGSSSTVDNFFAALPPDIILNGQKPALASIGPITSASLAKYGQAPAIEPQEYTIPALTRAIVDYFSKIQP